MDCLEALEWMEAAELGLAQDAELECELAKTHLETCADCQRNWQAQRPWASALAAAVSDVPIPEQLQERLRTSLELPSPMVVNPSGSTHEIQPARRQRRLVWMAAASTCAFLALFSVWIGFWSPAVRLTLAELYPAATVEMTELPNFQAAFVPRLPSSWSSLFVFHRSFVRGYPKVGASAGRVAVVPFLSPPLEGREALRGRLLMLSAKELALSPGDVPPQGIATDFSSAEVRYLRTGAAVAMWQEDDLIFVCLMSSGPADLQRFQRWLSGPRSFT